MSNSTEQQPSSMELLIKYYGCQPVSVGTGPTAIREAVEVSQFCWLFYKIKNFFDTKIEVYTWM